VAKQRSRLVRLKHARSPSLLRQARPKIIAALTVGSLVAWAVSGWSSKSTFPQVTVVLLCCVLMAGLYLIVKVASYSQKKFLVLDAV
jgi:hypothetical protein